MHNIQHYIYPEKVDKNKVYKELNNYVEHECWQEGGSLDKIRWETPILNSQEEAEKWIEKHDRGWYDNIAVRFKRPIKKNTEKLTEIERNITEAAKEYRTRNAKLYKDTVTSSYIGCKTCGSKLSREHLSTNLCPLCRAELRPEHMLKSVAAAKSRYERALKAEREYLEKHSDKEVCWIVKIEYHT